MTKYFVLILSLLASTQTAYATKTLTTDSVCIVDIQRVVTASDDIATLKNKRNNQVAELKKMADTANEKIKDERDEKSKKELSEKNLAEINAKKEEFDKIYAKELQESDKKLNDIILSVCKKKGGNMALNKATVIFGGIDITDDVIKKVANTDKEDDNTEKPAAKSIEKDGVAIIKQYDCPNELDWHQLCGVLENKTSAAKKVGVKVVYYDSDDIKLDETFDDINIAPNEKAKFETTSYIKKEPFDHYKIILIVN